MNFHGSEFNLKLEKTMKKYFVYIASAVLMMAACAKEEVNTPVETPVVGETELITVELNAATKTALDGTNTKWSAGDAVSVNFGGTSIGTLTLVEGNTFSGEITKGKSGAATLTYPAGVTAVPTTQVAVAGSFANGAALLEGETTIENLRAKIGTELQNKTALLEFSVAKAGDVTFEVGSTKYTVTGCKTGITYYACVAPASNVSFVARIGGYLSKKASSNKTFTVGKIADLGELPAPASSNIYLKGGWNSWGNTNPLYKENDTWYVAKNISITSDNTEFKFNDKSNNSDVWTGYDGSLYLNNFITTQKGKGGNAKINKGTYDFYFHKESNKFYVTTAGGVAPEVARPVRLLINNAGNKQSLRLYMWDSNGSPIIGSWNDRPTVTETETLNGTTYTYYELEQTYYGKTLNYKLTWNGGDSGDVKNVSFNQDNYYDLW